MPDIWTEQTPLGQTGKMTFCRKSRIFLLNRMCMSKYNRIIMRSPPNMLVKSLTMCRNEEAKDEKILYSLWHGKEFVLSLHLLPVKGCIIISLLPLVGAYNLVLCLIITLNRPH